MATTIQIEEHTREKLSSLKRVKGETYDDVIRELIEMAEEEKLELSEDAKRKVKIARAEFRSGKGISTKQLIAELGL